MKKYEEKEVVETITEIRTTCDICNSDMDQENLWGVTSKCFVTDMTPDFTAFHREIDICGKCMNNKILPLISNEYNVPIAKYIYDTNEWVQVQ